MADRSDFEPDRAHEYTDDIPGLDGDLIAELYDCVAKFGRPHRSPQMRQIGRDVPKPLHVSAVIDPPGNHNMMVGRSAYGISRARVRSVILSDEQRSAVVWDGDVAVEEVRALIEETDAPMRVLGLVRPDTGERTRMTYNEGVVTFAVDGIFTASGTVVIVPEGMSAESMRNMFDRPDELHLVVTQRGELGFVHTKDRTLVRLADAMTEALERMGITDPTEFEKLPKVVRDRIIAAAVRAAYGQNN